MSPFRSTSVGVLGTEGLPRRTHLEQVSLHPGHLEEHPQRHQEHTEESQAPAQRVGPGGIHVGLVELQRLVLQHGEDEGALGHKTKHLHVRRAGSGSVLPGWFRRFEGKRLELKPILLTNMLPSNMLNNCMCHSGPYPAPSAIDILH